MSEVLATGILTFIQSLVSELSDYEHTVIFRIRNLGHDVEDLIQLLPSQVHLIKWEKVDRSINPIRDFLAGKELYHILKKVKPDILHLHSSKAGVLGRLVGPSIISKNKIIYTPNGASFSRNDISIFSVTLFKIIEKISDLHSGRVIGVSRSEFNNYKKLGINPLLVNNGVKVGEIPALKIVNEDTILRIITVGRIVTQKNPNRFNEIALSFKSNPRVQFIWVGDGKKRDLLTSSNIQITGWLKPGKVESLLKECHIYLSTSDWEGLSFSTLEAMAVGLPLILSNCVGNVDLIKTGKTGFLFDSNSQAIEKLQSFLNNHSTYYSKMSVNAYNYCKQNFSLESMLSGYDRIYSSLHQGKNISDNSN